MPEAVLGRLELRGLVPRSLGPRPALALDRALGTQFRDALAEALEVLGELDPGSMWVLRRLDAQIAVPASEPDPAAQARRVAAGLAQAVVRVVVAGPSNDAVRFPSRAAHVAAYLRARLAGYANSWVFQRFDSIAGLSAADALTATARIVEVDVLNVVGELAQGDGWERLIAASTGAEIVRLDQAMKRRGDGVAAAPAVIAEVSQIWAERLDQAAGWRGPGVAAVPAVITEGSPAGTSGWARAPDAMQPQAQARARLQLLGALARDRPIDPGLVAAIWRVADARGGRALAGERAPGSSAWGTQVTPTLGALSAPGVVRGGAPDAGRAAGHADPLVFAAAGAGAFLLLADLAELLAGIDELSGDPLTAAAVRAAVLAGALGAPVEPDDEAVRLAAGWRAPPEPADWEVCLAGPVATLAQRITADPILGWTHSDDAVWAAAAFARHPNLGVIAIALMRRFARHLPGFGQARAAHLMPQVVPAGGTINVRSAPVQAAVVEAVLPTGPLHVLLALAGLDAFDCRVPWLPVRVVVSHEVPT